MFKHYVYYIIVVRDNAELKDYVELKNLCENLQYLPNLQILGLSRI